MNILFACDNNYIWLTGIAMISLFENNTDSEKIDVYLMGDGISEENKDILGKLAEKYNRKCIVIDVPDLEIPEELCSSRWPKSAFSRLFAGYYLPESVNKILYLDSDIIVNANIKDLWNTAVDDKIVYGVKDCISKSYRKNLGLNSNAPYVNAGVLLINVKKLREIQVAKKLEQYVKKYIKRIYYADQDILNGMLNSEIGTIEPRYNVMSLQALYSYDDVMKLRHPTNYYDKSEFERAVNSPNIIHYTTCMLSIRPWFSNTNHPFAASFQKYLALSPWRDVKLQEYQHKKNKRTTILNCFHKMPHGIGFFLLGWTHSVVVPVLNRMKK